jgi:starvation-inducible DNA-binding protein
VIKAPMTSVLEALDRVLADEFLLFVKTQSYFWNVEGVRFRELRQLFGENREDLAHIVDIVAERKRALGAFAEGATAEFAARSALRENPGRIPGAEEMLRNLYADHQAVVRYLIESADLCERLMDRGTMDLFIRLIQKHQKTAWTLDASLSRALSGGRERG